MLIEEQIAARQLGAEKCQTLNYCRLGLKRARWRGQWRVKIQDHLITIVQNIEPLMEHASHRAQPPTRNSRDARSSRAYLVGQ
jgi:hypothetical protein